MDNKYLKAPWHNTKTDLPSHSGERCICYNSFTHCEMEMIYRKSRPDSGYKDSFTECAYKGRVYDYDWITYWRYYTDREDYQEINK